MQINDTVLIEKMSNLGFGIAKQDGYVIFVMDEGADSIAETIKSKI